MTALNTARASLLSRLDSLNCLKTSESRTIDFLRGILQKAKTNSLNPNDIAQASALHAVAQNRPDIEWVITKGSCLGMYVERSKFITNARIYRDEPITSVDHAQRMVDNVISCIAGYRRCATAQGVPPSFDAEKTLESFRMTICCKAMPQALKEANEHADRGSEGIYQAIDRCKRFAKQGGILTPTLLEEIDAIFKRGRANAMPAILSTVRSLAQTEGITQDRLHFEVNYYRECAQEAGVLIPSDVADFFKSLEAR